MFEADATPLIGAIVVLLFLLCVWWLIVEWGFKAPVTTGSVSNQNRSTVATNTIEHTHQTKNHTAQQANDISRGAATDAKVKASTSPVDANKPHRPQTHKLETQKSVEETTFAATSVAATNTAQKKNSSTTIPDDRKARSTSGTNQSARLNDLRQSINMTSAEITKDTATQTDELPSTTGNSLPNPVALAGQSPATRLKPTDATVKASTIQTPVVTNLPCATETTKAHEKGKAVKSAPVAKYQTAAKSQSASVRSEASIQIQTTATRTGSNNPGANKHSEAVQTFLKQNSDAQSDAGANGSQTNTQQANTTAVHIGKSKKNPASADHKNASAAKPNYDDATAPARAKPSENTADAAVIATSPNNISSIGITANRSKPNTSNLKCVPNTAQTQSGSQSVSFKRNEANQRKQSSIEVAVERQINAYSDKPSGANSNKNTEANKTGVDQHSSNSGLNNGLNNGTNNATDSGSGTEPTLKSNSTELGDSVLRAQLANSERRIKSLQSTLSNLQQNTQAQTLLKPTGSAKPNQRESLLSKVRILEIPRTLSNTDN